MAEAYQQEVEATSQHVQDLELQLEDLRQQVGPPFPSQTTAPDRCMLILVMAFASYKLRPQMCWKDKDLCAVSTQLGKACAVKS